MKLRAALLGTVSTILLAGCTTFSFAPPRVDTESAVQADPTSNCGPKPSGRPRRIEPNSDGALLLINNFLMTYRCSAHEAADGRQIFEVPSLLALATAGIGASFGLSGDGRLAAAGGAALYDQANKYYAPKEKAKLLDSALDAVICIKTRAVGLGFFDVQADTESAKRIKELQAQLKKAEEQQTKLEAELEKIKQDRRSAQQDVGAALDYQASLQDQLAQQNEAWLSLPQSVRENDAEPLAVQSREAIAETAQEFLQAMSVDLRSKSRLAASLTELEADARRQIQEAVALKLNINKALTSLKLNEAQRVRDLVLTKDVNGGVISINIDRQYYELVAGSLFSVERILAQRFSRAGTEFDAEGIAAQVEKLTKDEEDNKEKKDAVEGANVDGAQIQAMKVDGATEALSFKTESDKNSERVTLAISELETNLQKCVIRAKI